METRELAQIPFDSAQGRFARRKERLLRMSIKLTYIFTAALHGESFEIPILCIEILRCTCRQQGLITGLKE